MAKAATATREVLYEAALSLFSEANLAADTFAANRRIRAIDRSRIRLGGLFRKQGALLMDKLEVIQPYFTRRDALLEHAGPELFWEAVDDDLGAAFAEIFAVTKAQADDTLAMTLNQGLSAGFSDAASGFGIEGSFNIPNRRATDWSMSNAANRVSGVNATTEAQIRNIVTTGLQNGTSYGEVGRQISKRFSEFAGDDPHSYIRSRAELVAVTENAFAYESGSRSLVDEITAVGVTMEKSYGGPNDSITSDGCRENLAAGWIPLDEPFPTGIQHPPNHPGCRHDTMYQVADAPSIPAAISDEDYIKILRDQEREDYRTSPHSVDFDKWSSDQMLDDLLDIESNEKAELLRKKWRAGEDPYMEQVADRQGFSGLPQVMDLDEFNQYLYDHSIRTDDILYRGVSGADRVEEFRSGDYFAGQGMYANGTYTVRGEGSRRLAFKTYADQNEGGLMRMILNEDALVVDYGALLDQQADALTALDGLIGDAESAGEDGTLERMEALKIVFQDEGRFAAAAGYDAIAIPYEDQTSGGAHPGQTQVVILNRTAVIVDDSMFAWNYERKAWTWNKRPS